MALNPSNSSNLEQLVLKGLMSFYHSDVRGFVSGDREMISSLLAILTYDTSNVKLRNNDIAYSKL